MANTKRALLTSALAIVACVAMLIGSTFAWFTDTASTGVNKIQAGNLDVKLEYKNADTKDFAEAKADTKVFNENALWEPGHVEYVVLKVSNVGSLALKYKLGINIAGETGSTNVDGKEFKLSDYIRFAVIDGDQSSLGRDALVTEAGEGAVLNAGYTKEDHLNKKGDANIVTLVVWMPTTVGNEANYRTGEAAPEIQLGINVYATQDTVESDSFNNQYDKDATYLTYPAGVTTDTFPETVSYPTFNGKTETAEAVAAYIDSEGNVQYAADVANAIKAGATTIYLKKDAEVKAAIWGTNRTPDLTSDLTVYANGADFQYGQISMNMTDAGKAANVTVKVYDAKNIEVWGLTPNDGVTQNIVMENCTNVGKVATGDSGILMYITGNTGTVNAVVNNCYVEKNSSGIYMSTNGSLTVTNSTFVECAAGIKSSYKGNGTRADRIENCVFTKCGCTAEMAGNTSWLSEDSSAFKYKISSGATGTLSLTLKNNTITGTLGDKGDMQIADGVTVVNE